MTRGMGEASTPVSTIRVHRLEDPYDGTILFPAEVEPETRALSAEIEIHSESHRRLVVGPEQLRLRVADGQELTAGVIGTAPGLHDVKMLPGEQTRGCVGFAVPDTSEVTAIIFGPPPPLLENPLTSSVDSQ